MSRAGIQLNGVRYRWPSRPVVVVCIDGGDPAYFEQGVRDGIVPNVARFMKKGFSAVADGDVPSFTCPNNMSIATGSPPSVHGISGNFYLDPATGEAVVMTGPELLRSRTDHGGVLAARRARRLDHRQGQAAPRSSARRWISATAASTSRPSAPTSARWRRRASTTRSSSPACRSPTCTRPSCRCSCSRRASSSSPSGGRTSCYLSLTDYVQHKYAPGEPEADRYYRDMDDLFGAPRRPRRDRGAHRRPRHERQVEMPTARPT